MSSTMSESLHTSGIFADSAPIPGSFRTCSRPTQLHAALRRLSRGKAGHGFVWEGTSLPCQVQCCRPGACIAKQVDKRLGPIGAPCRVRNQARDAGRVADGLQLDDGVGQVLQTDGEGCRVEACTHIDTQLLENSTVSGSASLSDPSHKPKSMRT